MLTPKEESEIVELSERFGAPLRWTRDYDFTTERNRTFAKRISRRRGEVILVVPRPGNRVLLHTKSTYPDAVYRLPGGGVNANEAVEPAARREAYEEMGFQAALARLVGVIENVFHLDGETLNYPSYIFLTQATTEPPHVVDGGEQITGFSETPLKQLGRVVAQLEALPPEWQPWGLFRAAPHALVLDALER